MSKFKVGDRVVCIDARTYSGLLIEGDHYTISGVSDSGEYVNILEDPSKVRGWFPRRFRLAGPAEEPASSFYDETPEIAEIRANFLQQQEKT